MWNSNGIVAGNASLTIYVDVVDLCFECSLLISDPEFNKHFQKMTIEQRAEWVAHQLRGCGFDTTPVGMSWGVLTKENT